MNFREALAQVLQSENAEFASNPFWLYCRLSDLCKSYIDRQKITLLFEIDKRLHIVGTIMTDGRIAELTLKAAYPAVKTVINAESYKNLITCVAEAAFPTVDMHTESAKVKVATIQKAEKEEKQESRTPLYSKPNYALRWAIGIAAGLLVIAGIVCLCIFGKYINWTGWQHIIGSLGGILISSSIVFLVWFFGLYTIQYESWPRMLVLFAVALLNGVLYYFLRENYKIIFIWLSAYELFWGSFLVLISFAEYEKCWAVVEIIETLVILIAMILGLIFL